MAWAPSLSTCTTMVDFMGMSISIPTCAFGSVVPITTLNPGENMLNAGYLMTWIFAGTIGIPTFIMGIMTMAGIDPAAYMYFSEIWGLWGSVFGMSLQWIFTSIFAATMVNASNIGEYVFLLIWDIGVAFVIWVAMSSIYADNI